MTPGLGTGLALATLAGAAIPLGGWLASAARFYPRWRSGEFRHAVIAFGAGALLAAVAFVLVPEGERMLPGQAALAASLFALGGIAFFLLDRALQRRGTQMAQFMAMMLDYVPEALALGALLGAQPSVAMLTAALIALQNLPEAFNAFREITRGPPDAPSPRRVLTIFVLMVPLGPLAAWLGMEVLGGLPALLGGVMLFSAGGILYLVMQDVAPQVRLDRHWGPPLGAVAGFALGLAGHLATGGAG